MEVCPSSGSCEAAAGMGHRIHVLGASGSGSTTLARALASVLSVRHFDADDYYWLVALPSGFTASLLSTAQFSRR